MNKLNKKNIIIAIMVAIFMWHCPVNPGNIVNDKTVATNFDFTMDGVAYSHTEKVCSSTYDKATGETTLRSTFIDTNDYNALGAVIIKWVDDKTTGTKLADIIFWTSVNDVVIPHNATAKVNINITSYGPWMIPDASGTATLTAENLFEGNFTGPLDLYKVSDGSIIRTVSNISFKCAVPSDR